jgi:lysophospholipase L1-like esterase
MKSILFRLLCLFAALTSVSVAAPERWAKEIAALTKDDETKPPVPGAVLFVGSSSIRLWESLSEDFRNIPIINRGFGGSQIADSTFYASRIIISYRPRAIVLYAGENDIADGKTAEAVAQDFQSFRTKIHEALPEAHIYYLSIKFSPSRAKFRDSMHRANELIAADCEQVKNCTFVDVNIPMLNSAGQPRPELFQDDLLHMRAAGYAIWTKVLNPLLRP